ncbi:MAG: peptidoglycan DD-metalloendopeptidase family protein [Nocardioidaceae bacterium]
MLRNPAGAAPARALALLVTAAVLCGGAATPVATAAPKQAVAGKAAAKHAAKGELAQAKKAVEKRLAGAHEDLDESSQQLRDATSALASAQAELASAQAHLAETKGELVAAQALDARMRVALAAARQRLRTARADLGAGHDKIAEEQDTLGQIVVQHYQSGDPSLLGLSMVLTSQDPAELTGQLNSVQNVIDKESVVLDRLEADRALLTVQEREVLVAQRAVARQRRAAAANLLRKQGLEAQAEAAKASVDQLVDARTEARSAAAQAQAADLAQLEGLEQERNRIAAVLKRRADEARRRAAAAAAAAGQSAGPILGDSGPIRSNGVLDYPVSGRVTSPFGWRVHPIYGYRALHDGVDFGAACGTPIRAVASGRVVERYFQTAWGNRVIIDHGLHRGAGLATISNHLSSYAVSAGERVERGQIIGYVGTTGWSTGCHLHFTVLRNGAPVDPMAWF